MSLADICALPVAELASESCVLFLWTTAPCREQAFEVIRAWGFAYKTSLVWDKEVMGMGHWVRGQHEDLLIASKGNPPLPPTESVPASVFRERRREHSRKPEASYRIIEAMYPDLLPPEPATTEHHRFHKVQERAGQQGSDHCDRADHCRPGRE
jgi:N6-adenosine-specific RNA methylase IME4